MAYAERTDVPFDRSIQQLQQMLRKRGARQIVFGEDDDRFAIQFCLSDRMIRFRLSLADPASRRSADQIRRSRARALLLVVKAKLESVDTGIETIEQAFLANVVMMDGLTVHERISDEVALEYASGRPNATHGLLPPPRESQPG